MIMGELEICKEYRTAKDPAEQIEVLAQLNQVPPGKIIEILKKNGVSVNYAPGKRKPGRRRKTPVPLLEKEEQAAEAERIPDRPEEAGAPRERESAAAAEPEAAAGPREEPVVWPWTSLTQLGTLRAINRLLLEADKEAKAGDELAAATSFRERVRGALALLHELTD